MAKRKKKPIIHKVNPVIIREVNEVDDIVKNHYIPMIEENISKSEPDTEPMEIEPTEEVSIIEELVIEIPTEIITDTQSVETEAIEKLKKPKKSKPKKSEERVVISEQTTELIQDHDIIYYNINDYFNTLDNLEEIEDSKVVINPNIDLSIVHRFIEISRSPFELRYKTTKIYDSRTSVCDITFNENHVAVDGKKYPYSNLRIINK